MRVVSQSGMFDFPYEQVAVYRNDNNVFCRFSNVEKSANLLGSYSTVEKAQKAMEMCRERYLSRMELNGGFDMVNGCYVQPNYWVLPKVFQFPTDDEVVTNET